MGMQFPTTPRIAAQGESKRTFRWDLMRPKARPVPARPKSVKDILAAHAGVDPDMAEKARAILKHDYEQRHELLSTTPSRIRKMAWHIAGRYGVEPYLIFGMTRTRGAVLARQELCYRLRMEGKSFPEIARLTKRRDHTTVIHAVQAHKARRLAGKVPA